MNGIPSGEIIFVKRTTTNGDIYYITAKPLRDMYYLYKVENNKAIKLGKDKNPRTLESQFIQEP